MTLPLLTRAIEEDARFLFTPRARSPKTTNDARMPRRTPGPGEQYRFHFDMGKCIGCKCCVVACNEQNGNPAAINWRRVRQIEGGWYPDTRRAYLSMGCNHCIDPTCLKGCPVDAYTKDSVTGIVRHSADACIGCQYCTWNCSYGVPQYNPERGVVGKCDMCYGRLEQGQAPACVSACPEGAIQVEIVKLASWRAAVDAAAPGTGAPAADGSLSTTRITPLRVMPPNARPVDLINIAPEDPHWPLVVMTVLTQLSAGAFATIWLLQLFATPARLGAAAVTALSVAALALNASTLHLGRPIHAYRALRMWRRSWLSREVLLFTLFAGVASLYAGALWFAFPVASFLGGLTTVLGLAGVTASACIYRVPSRPSWNTPLTLVQFNLTAATLGPLFVAGVGAAPLPEVTLAAVTMAGAQLLLVALSFVRMVAASSVELQGSARLLSTTLRPLFVLRGALLVFGAIVLPLLANGGVGVWLALAATIAGELTGRYLFFVSVVPMHLATPYLTMGSEAA